MEISIGFKNELYGGTTFMYTINQLLRIKFLEIK